MPVFAFDEFVFDEEQRVLRRAGTALKTDALVLDMLAYLVRNPAG